MVAPYDTASRDQCLVLIVTQVWCVCDKNWIARNMIRSKLSLVLLVSAMQLGGVAKSRYSIGFSIEKVFHYIVSIKCVTRNAIEMNYCDGNGNTPFRKQFFSFRFFRWPSSSSFTDVVHEI